jgi:guanine deaminase
MYYLDEKEKHKHYMREAIKIAKKGIKNGQAPFGACIVKNNKILACEHNLVWKNKDPTMHAEVNTIRRACKKLRTIDLSGCILYTTTEPCPMCFSAAHWAKIDLIIYGASINDAEKAGFSELTISNKEMKALGKSKIKIKNGILKKECKELFKIWEEAGKSKTY